MVLEEIHHHLEEVRHISTAIEQKETGRMDQVGECKRQSCHMGQPQTHGTQNTKFPYKGSLQTFTNTGQPSCLGVNYIRPMQNTWEKFQPQTYSYWMRAGSKKLHVEIQRSP